MTDVELIAAAREESEWLLGIQGDHGVGLLAALADALAAHQWQPIETAPKDGTFVLLAGPSGYTTTPLRVEVCRYYPEYRPRNPWQTHSDDAFTDGGDEPTHWMHLPAPPETTP